MQDTIHLGFNRAFSPTTQCSIFMLLESVNISLHEYVSYSFKPLLSIHIIYRPMSLAVYLRLRFSSELLPQFTNSLLYSCLLIPPKPQNELWIGPSLNLLPTSFPISVTSFSIHTIAQGKPWMCLFPSPCPRSSHYLISNAEANIVNSTSTVCLKSTFLHLQLHHWYSTTISCLEDYLNSSLFIHFCCPTVQSLHKANIFKHNVDASLLNLKLLNDSQFHYNQNPVPYYAP